MFDVHDQAVQMKITSVVCSVVAVTSTIYRLVIRRGRYWADDGCAFFSVLALLLQVASVFMHVPNPAELSRLNRVAAYYILATTFYATIWSARLSILFSMIRLDHSQTRRRRLFYVAGLYLLVAVILISQLFWVCELEPGWKNDPTPQCILNKQVAISQLVSDIIADLILITVPLNILAGLRDKRLRLRLIFIFSTSIVTTIVSLVHAVYILNNGKVKVLISALVEDCMSLFVCNIPVVVNSIFKLGDGGSQDNPKAPIVSTRIQFMSKPPPETAIRLTMTTITDRTKTTPDYENGKSTVMDIDEEQPVFRGKTMDGRQQDSDRAHVI